MALIQDKIYTIDDIYTLPEGERAELIDGNIYHMAPPQRKHQRIITELSTIINNYIKSNNGPCEIDIAPFAVFLNESGKNMLNRISVLYATKTSLRTKAVTVPLTRLLRLYHPAANAWIIP